MNKAEYRQYLESDHWKQTRKEALKHYGNKCFVCISKNNPNVHHRRYQRGKVSILYQETMDDLIVLCRDCHAISHQVRRTPMKIKHLRRVKAMMALGISKQDAFANCADGRFTKWRHRRGLSKNAVAWKKPKPTKKAATLSEFIDQHHARLREPTKSPPKPPKKQTKRQPRHTGESLLRGLFGLRSTLTD